MQGRYYYPTFANEEIEVRESEVACIRSHAYQNRGKIDIK